MDGDDLHEKLNPVSLRGWGGGGGGGGGVQGKEKQKTRKKKQKKKKKKQDKYLRFVICWNSPRER